MTAKRDKRQSGFALVALLLVIVVLAVAGFAGWQLMQNSTPEKSAETVKAKPKVADIAPTDAKPGLPEGFVQVESKALGITFAFPKAWGEASVAPGREAKHLIKGSDFAITFSNNASVTAGLQSKDWEHDPNLGHDGGFNVGFESDATFEEYVKEPGDEGGFPAVTYSRSATSFIIGTTFGGIGCDSAGELLVHKLAGHKTYPGIAFAYIEKKYDHEGFNKETGAVPEDVCAESNYKKYLSTEHADELKKIDATIANL